MKPLTFQEIAAEYVDLVNIYDNEENEIDKKIGARQQQIDRLQKRKKKIGPYPYWTELFLRPIINEIKKHFPGWECDDERLTPMGLGSRVSVFFNPKDDPKKYIYIVFVPMEIGKGHLSYETGDSSSRFASGTIGEINGFNRHTKPIDSIDELVQFLQKQIHQKQTH